MFAGHSQESGQFPDATGLGAELEEGFGPDDGEAADLGPVVVHEFGGFPDAGERFVPFGRIGGVVHDP